MKLKLNPDLSIRKIDTEVFIFDRNRSLVHTFNETGAFLWNAFENNIEENEIVEKLTQTFEIDKTTAAADVEAFFTKVCLLGLAVTLP